MDLITLALSKKFTSDAIEAIDEAKVDKTDIVQSDWNQNDETSPDHIKNRPFYEGEPEIHYNLPEITISDETSLSLGFTHLQGTLSIEDGKTYEVIINGNVYTAKCVQIDSSGFTLGDKNLQEYPFYFMDRGFIYQIKYGVQEAPITIAVRTTTNSIKKLERKFVDGIVGMDVEGKIFPYQDENYIAGNGAEIFNSYLTNKALGQYSHAEGESTNAIGFASHAEGCVNTAYGMYTHAEGLGTKAYGDCSHTEGWNTIASGEDQHVQGKYNIEDTESKYAHIVGNGESTYNEGDKRSNAHTLDWDGNAWYQGDIYVGSTSGTNKDEGSKKLATEEYVNTEVANLVNSAPETLDTLGELATALEENSDIIEVLNESITNKADKSEIVQSDYNQNDENAIDYIKNRPFYEDEPEEYYPLPEMVIEDADVLQDGMTTMRTVPIEIGKTYEVLYNNEIYTAECYQGAIGASLGDEALQEYPFYLFDGGWATMLRFIPQEEPLTFYIKGYNALIKKLDRKFVDGIVGMDVEGKVFEYDGKQYTAQRYAEIFNDSGNIAVGYSSHAEGYATKALGGDSHAEGYGTVAKGAYSHSEGRYTIASGESQHVQGKFNIEDTSDKYAHIVGNGKHSLDDSGRSNAHTLDWDGNAEFAGDVKVNACGGENPISLITLSEDVANLKESGIGGNVTVDSELSETSLNPVQNKVVTKEIRQLSESMGNIGGTVEVTSGEPTKENTILTVNPSSEEVNIYTAEEIDEMIDSIENGSGVTDEQITQIETNKNNIVQLHEEKVDKNGKGQVSAENTTFFDVISTGHGKNHLDITKAEVGQLDPANGEVLAEYTSFRVSDFIPCKPNENYVISVNGQIIKANRVCFYDSNKAFVSALTSLNTWLTPINCAYFRVGVYDEFNPKHQIEMGTTITPFEEYTSTYETILKDEYSGNLSKRQLRGKKILVFGDSITAMIKGWREQFYKQTGLIEIACYAVGGAHLADYEDTVLDGITFTDSGNTICNQVQAVLNNPVETPDIIIISAGTNDALNSQAFEGETDVFKGGTDHDWVDIDTVDRTTWEGAMRWQVEKLYSLYPHTKIFYASPIQASEEFRYYDHIIWKEQKMIRICNKMAIPVIKAGTESGIWGRYEIKQENGKYLVDGLHPNEQGGIVLGNFYATQINNYFNL